MTTPINDLHAAYHIAYEMIQENSEDGPSKEQALSRLREAFFWAFLSAKGEDRPLFTLLKGGLESEREKVGASERETEEPPPGA